MARKRAARVTPPAPVPPLPTPLSPAVRESVQLLLRQLEASIAQLRARGAFDVLGILAQAGHALKLCADHSFALERAMGLGPAAPPAAAETTTNTTNGVKS